MVIRSKPKYEVADVIHILNRQIFDNDKFTKHQKRTFNALRICRTSKLGGHKEKCSSCGNERYSYNSCRNRNCPKCQNINREEWIHARKRELLPVKYYHVVFTIPHEFNCLCLKYPNQIYKSLFKSAWNTLNDFGKDPKHLGAQMGMTSILHTWGQDLSLHPHLHCIVPGGGITKNGKWKQSKSKGKYLFPEKALSTVFRAKFLSAIRNELGNPIVNNVVTSRLAVKQWIVYCKKSFDNPKYVIEYLGRYTHKVAISNHRIKSIDDKNVIFSYKKYKQNGITSEMKLPLFEFVRRFSLHIVPPGFMRIRHYGFLSSRFKEENLTKILANFNKKLPKKEKLSIDQLYDILLDYQVKKCPYCEKGEMIIIETYTSESKNKSPPEDYFSSFSNNYK